MSTTALPHTITSDLTVEFCGEAIEVDRTPFTIGRAGDVVLDDTNRFLHRQFVSLERTAGVWTLVNVGSRLTATVSDDDGLVDAHLAPGAALPLVFATTVVRCTAGPTTYEFEIRSERAMYVPVPTAEPDHGDPTNGHAEMTPDQLRLIIALAEPALTGAGRTSASLPTSSEAARRLGWTLTRFNRKLDHVCEKLERQGVRGLHGAPGRLASNRRARLVEYALASRLVTRDDLPLLERPAGGDLG